MTIVKRSRKFGRFANQDLALPHSFPASRTSPCNVVDAYRLDEPLRLGADYDAWKPKAHFRFPDDHGDFSHAALRCVGVGECRRMEGKTMCPSFRATLEEKDTTRGRA